jgi:hypothetical protein
VNETPRIYDITMAHYDGLPEYFYLVDGREISFDAKRERWMIRTPNEKGWTKYTPISKDDVYNLIKTVGADTWDRKTISVP